VGGSRDNWVSLPLVRRSEMIRRISTVGTGALSLSGTALVANAYAPTSEGAFYVQFVTGNLAGLSYKIISNTSSEVVLETMGDDLRAPALGGIAAGERGDLIRIRPYWTVADVFGHDSSTVLLDPVPALSPVIYTEDDALLFPDNQSIGTKKSPAMVIAYVAGQGWRRQGQSTTDCGSTEFPAGVPFVLRRQSTTSLTTFVVGYVSQEPGLIRLPALPENGETDISAALFHPVPVRLADSGLAVVMESSLDDGSAKDLLLCPSDARPGFSIPPARRLHLENATWYEGEVSANEQTLRSGSGFVLRLKGERPVRYWRQAAPN